MYTLSKRNRAGLSHLFVYLHVFMHGNKRFIGMKDRGQFVSVLFLLPLCAVQGLDLGCCVD